MGEARGPDEQPRSGAAHRGPQGQAERRGPRRAGGAWRSRAAAAQRVGAGGRPLAGIARQPAFLVFGLVALASFSSGEMLLVGGWDAVNLLVLPVALACLAALFWQLRRQARAA